MFRKEKGTARGANKLKVEEMKKPRKKGNSPIICYVKRVKLNITLDICLCLVLFFIGVEGGN